MPRALRMDYAGAMYHLINRGDRREPILRDDADRKGFLETLGQACPKTDWQVHGLCLMGNHFHLVMETPRANLVAGMKWFLGTYTARFNHSGNCGGKNTTWSVGAKGMGVKCEFLGGCGRRRR